MSKELNREELIAILDSWQRMLDYDNHWNKADWEDEQAHQQIRQIIKEYPYLKNGTKIKEK